VETRAWPVPARHMEAEEEDYFNADDDDDDHNIPSISAPLNRGQGPIPPNALKRKRRVAISGQQRMYRPLNVSNTLRAPSPPPFGSLVDYDEDGEDPSGLKPVEGDNAMSPPMRTIEIPSGPKLMHQQLPPSPRRPVSDDDEENVLEALARPKVPPPPPPSGAVPPPISMAPLRPSEKRRRDEEEEEDSFGWLERLRKNKKVDPAASNLVGRGSSPKASEEPPKKLRLKFGSPKTLESSSSTRTQSGKDGGNG
jgi:protein phosphatase-4 regulatory subunit 3